MNFRNGPFPPDLCFGFFRPQVPQVRTSPHVVWFPPDGEEHHPAKKPLLQGNPVAFFVLKRSPRRSPKLLEAGPPLPLDLAALLVEVPQKSFFDGYVLGVAIPDSPQ